MLPSEKDGACVENTASLFWLRSKSFVVRQISLATIDKYLQQQLTNIFVLFEIRVICYQINIYSKNWQISSAANDKYLRQQIYLFFIQVIFIILFSHVACCGENLARCASTEWGVIFGSSIISRCQLKRFVIGCWKKILIVLNFSHLFFIIS